MHWIIGKMNMYIIFACAAALSSCEEPSPTVSILFSKRHVCISAMYGGLLIFLYIYCSFEAHVSGLLLIVIMNDIYGVFRGYISCCCCYQLLII